MKISHALLALLSVIIALCLGVSACGGGGTAVPPTSLPAAGAGQTVHTRDVEMSLESVDFSGGVLTANFVVKNTGGTELSMSSRFNFEAADDEGNAGVVVGCTEASYPLLSFRVRTGDQVKGSLCWKLTESTKSFVIYYRKVASGPVIFTFEGQLP